MPASPSIVKPLSVVIVVADAVVAVPVDVVALVAVAVVAVSGPPAPPAPAAPAPPTCVVLVAWLLVPLTLRSPLPQPFTAIGAVFVAVVVRLSDPPPPPIPRPAMMYAL